MFILTPRGLHSCILIPLAAALKIDLQGAQMLIDRQSPVDCGRAALA